MKRIIRVILLGIINMILLIKLNKTIEIDVYLYLFLLFINISGTIITVTAIKEDL